MLLLLKTNDCLRHTDRVLGAPFNTCAAAQIRPPARARRHWPALRGSTTAQPRRRPGAGRTDGPQMKASDR